jgi:two-component system NtrC family response regulator
MRGDPFAGSVRCLVLRGSCPQPELWSHELGAGIRLAFAGIDSTKSERGLEWCSHFDVLLIDADSLEPAGRAGAVAAAIARLVGHNAANKVIVILDSADPETARQAVEAGAWDMLSSEELFGGHPSALLRGAHLHRICVDDPFDEEGDELAAPDTAAFAEDEEGAPLQMIGTSEPMRRVFRLTRRVAASDVSVLITGESGTGKELTAIAIHDHSNRSKGPFAAINCGAIPESLLEAELFGHDKGAFTGATRSRPGRFEAAQGGTIFLDEIGEMPPLLQVKLLRFLENHVVEPLGTHKKIPLDVRVIAATNKDLTAAVQRGEFREDLYFRLAVFTIHIPPLRERSEDALLMARTFLHSYAREAGRSLRGFTPEATDAILEAPWKGNVRELVNRVRRAVVVADGAYVTPFDLGFDGGREATCSSLREARRAAEVKAIHSALRRANFNKVDAARLLGISRTQLYERMSRYGIASEEWG